MLTRRKFLKRIPLLAGLVAFPGVAWAALKAGKKPNIEPIEPAYTLIGHQDAVVEDMLRPSYVFPLTSGFAPRGHRLKMTYIDGKRSYKVC